MYNFVVLCGGSGSRLWPKSREFMPKQFLKLTNDKTMLQNTVLRIKDVKKINNFNFNDYLRGWLIGNFEPCIKKTTNFEIGLLTHLKNEKWDFHYHKKSTEINILIDGKMNINNKNINKHDVFVFDNKYERVLISNAHIFFFVSEKL
jgi:NDP-sugar pyrophosphorylase family protein